MAEPLIAPDEVSRAADLASAHEHRDVLGALAFDVMSRQGQAKTLFAGREFVEHRAAAYAVERPMAATDAGNLLTILERGPQNIRERALLAAFAVEGLRKKLAESGEQGRAELLRRFVSHADWLLLSTPYALYPFARAQLPEEQLDMLWAAVADAVLEDDDCSAAGRARNAARLTVLGEAMGEGPRRELGRVAREAHDPALSVLARTFGADVAPDDATAGAPPSGETPAEPETPVTDGGEGADTAADDDDDDAGADDAADADTGAGADADAGAAAAADDDTGAGVDDDASADDDDAAADADAAHEVTVHGSMGRAPTTSLRELLGVLTGITLVIWLLRAVGSLVGFRREAELALVSEGVRVRRRTRLLGRTVREGDETYALSAVAAVGRQVRYPALHMLVGLVALAVGVMIGGFWMIEAIESGELVLLVLAAGVVLVGAGLDLALNVLVPGGRGRVALELRVLSGKGVRLVRVAIKDADRFLEALSRRLASAA